MVFDYLTSTIILQFLNKFTLDLDIRNRKSNRKILRIAIVEKHIFYRKIMHNGFPVSFQSHKQRDLIVSQSVCNISKFQFTHFDDFVICMQQTTRIFPFSTKKLIHKNSRRLVIFGSLQQAANVCQFKITVYLQDITFLAEKKPRLSTSFRFWVVLLDEREREMNRKTLSREKFRRLAFSPGNSIVFAWKIGYIFQSGPKTYINDGRRTIFWDFDIFVKRAAHWESNIRPSMSVCIQDKNLKCSVEFLPFVRLGGLKVSGLFMFFLSIPYCELSSTNQFLK